MFDRMTRSNRTTNRGDSKSLAMTSGATALVILTAYANAGAAAPFGGFSLPTFSPVGSVPQTVPIGDLDGDGVVNGADLATLLTNWGISSMQ